MAKLGRPPKPFWSRVAFGAGGGCWTWTGPTAGGYGKANLTPGAGSSRHAHRIAFVLMSGEPIPAGKHVLHSCDNTACVNPEHLRLGTHADNMRDALVRDRFRPGGRACVGGRCAPVKLKEVLA